MWIVKESQLKEFWKRYPAARGPPHAWIKEIEAARHENPAQIRAAHRSADFIGNKVIFNIGGNKYRLIVRIRYASPRAKPPLNGIVRVLFIGTHEEYNAIDVRTL